MNSEGEIQIMAHNDGRRRHRIQRPRPSGISFRRQVVSLLHIAIPSCCINKDVQVTISVHAPPFLRMICCLRTVGGMEGVTFMRL